MTRRQIELVSCDRCHFEERSDEAPMRGPGWGRAFVASDNGQDLIGTIETPADFCPECLTDLRDWMDRAGTHRTAAPEREAAE